MAWCEQDRILIYTLFCSSGNQMSRPGIFRAGAGEIVALSQPRYEDNRDQAPGDGADVKRRQVGHGDQKRDPRVWRIAVGEAEQYQVLAKPPPAMNRYSPMAKL